MENKEKTCPKCRRGSLGLLTADDLIRSGYDINAEVYGCDECQHAEDRDGYQVFKTNEPQTTKPFTKPIEINKDSDPFGDIKKKVKSDIEQSLPHYMPNVGWAHPDYEQEVAKADAKNEAIEDVKEILNNLK